MSAAICPQCGSTVDARALHVHKGSRPCKAARGRKRIEEENLEPLNRQPNTRVQTYLQQEHGSSAIEEIPVGYNEGSKTTAGRLKTMYCTTTPLAKEAQRNVLPSDTGEKHPIRADGDNHLLAGQSVNALAVVSKDGVDTTRKRKVRIHTPSLCDSPICYALDGQRIGGVIATDVSPVSLYDYLPEGQASDMLLSLWTDD